ncbi:rod-determining factor RdfA [Haloplanus aerogenes]|uniref:Uncharacterized protein n=1 Tax=Haloplanus aerogenes TaxID=660522 RepID=A0A3M0DST4_9EURY|nr:rod-determining factor RdfA [Haloplanus aerogenes]AZH25345.1 hypothetical protein DU502_08105 [Haloplanus aerogenes]RMB25042.1 hypothetical protein ATH50_0125 [Haloplanus aerogenes]
MSGPGRRSKVATAIETHDLDGIGAELESRWSREQDRWSLRRLADYFNAELLEQMLREAGGTTVEIDPADLYDRVQSDDRTTRTEAERLLERAGVDVDALRSEFVSYQAIRTYLRSHRGAEPPTDDGPTVDDAVGTIRRLDGRLTSVARDRLSNLDDLAVASPRVLTSIRVYCDDCGARLDLDALDDGACNCFDDSN